MNVLKINLYNKKYTRCEGLRNFRGQIPRAIGPMLDNGAIVKNGGLGRFSAFEFIGLDSGFCKAQWICY